MTVRAGETKAASISQESTSQLLMMMMVVHLLSLTECERERENNNTQHRLIREQQNSYKSLPDCGQAEDIWPPRQKQNNQHSQSWILKNPK